MSLDSKRSFAELHRFVDGDEPFMTWGHEVHKDRSAGGNLRRWHRPDWVHSQSKVRELLIRSFPNWDTNQTQKVRMLRWYQVIYRYYRLQEPVGRVAKHFNITEDEIKNILSRIRQAAQGLNTAGKPRHAKLEPKFASVKRREGRSRELQNHLRMDNLLAPIAWQRVKHKNRSRLVPQWVTQKKIDQIIRTSFPKFDSRHFDQARQWYQIIHYYYRKKATRKETARLMNTSDGQVRDTLMRITRVLAGQNTAGRTRRQVGAGNRSMLLNTPDVEA